MNLCPHGGSLHKRLPVLVHQTARLGVEGAIWIRVDEQTLDGEQDLLHTVISRPVLLQRRDADLTGTRDVRVKDGRGKSTAWRMDGKVDPVKVERDAEISSLVRRRRRTGNPAAERKHVGIVQRDPDTVRWTLRQRSQLARQRLDHRR